METRRLIDLRSVGKRTVEDLHLLGITKVEQLKNKDASKLYRKLQKMQGGYLDICVEDVFKCAIEQAKNKNLSDEKCDWWYWSKIRKSR